MLVGVFVAECVENEVVFGEEGVAVSGNPRVLYRWNAPYLSRI